MTPLMAAAPEEVQVLPYGTHETGRGRFTFDERSAREVIRAFRLRGREMVVDYEHQTLGAGEAPAAGWITGLTFRGRDGLWATVRWTRKAAAYLASGEYRYLSPVFLKREGDGAVTRLINVALTNQPAIDALRPVTNIKKEVRMQSVNGLLGLADGASEKEQTEALAALLGEITALGELREFREFRDEIAAMLSLEAGAEAGSLRGALRGVLKSAEDADRLALENAELGAKVAAREAESLVAEAMKQGKVTPAQRGWALDYAKEDPAAFGAFVARAPRVVHFGESHGRTMTHHAGASLDTLQVSVNRALGVSDESFRKFANTSTF